MYLHDHDDQNNTAVSTQLIANSHRLLSLTKDNVSPPPFMPEELIEKILLKLSVRHLVQFMCVCKLWKTLISDSQFAMKHLLCSTADQSMTRQRLACANVVIPEKIESYPLKSLFENPSTPLIPDSFSSAGLNCDMWYDIIGSCNGLLCLYEYDLYDIDHKCSTFILYNPTIRLKSKKTPKFAIPGWVMRFNGFGYDQVNGKYKVLVVLDKSNSNETLTKIYTCGEDSWRTIPNSPCTPINMLNGETGKHVSGTLNWISSYNRDVASNQYTIISFDTEKETYRELLMPQNFGDDYKWPVFLYDLTNCLCVGFVSQTHWVVWLMKEYGVVESWTKLTTIPLVKFISCNEYPFEFMLFISENGVLLMSTTSQLILYNINSGRLDFPSIRSNNCVLCPHIYHESLISPPQW